MKLLSRISYFVSTGVVAGFIAGLIKYYIYVRKNNYITYKMFGIIKSEISYCLNKWVLGGVLVAILYLFGRYFIFPLFWRALKMVLKFFFADSINIVIQDRHAFYKRIVIIAIVSIFIIGGWVFNHYVLPGEYEPASIFFNISYFLILAGIGWLLLKYGWDEMIDMIIKRKTLIYSAVFAMIFLVVSNLYSLSSDRNKDIDGPNVIFICNDALGAKHLGFYGYGRDTSPFMDELARRGALFTDVTSQSSWTKTSVATFFTSDYRMLSLVSSEDSVLPFEVNTLAEILKNVGYETAAFVANPWLLPRFNFNQGFDYYNSRYVSDKYRRRINISDIINYIDSIKEGKFFLYIHFMDVHNPYEPPVPFDRQFADGSGKYRYTNGPIKINRNDLEKTKGLYDGEIRALDEKIKNLVDYIEKKGLMEKTIIVINADHGDEFMEHGGLGHGTTLYQELLHVPLLIVYENDYGIRPGIIDHPVRNIDILPTILDLLGVHSPSKVDGNSLLPLIRKDNVSRKYVPIVASVISHYGKDRLISFRENNLKYIHNITKDIEELYDLSNDPDEASNIIPVVPKVGKIMNAASKKFIKQYLMHDVKTTNRYSIDDETLRTLKSLGYVQ
jgi:arylsulfatase A-like enzyme